LGSDAERGMREFLRQRKAIIKLADKLNWNMSTISLLKMLLKVDDDGLIKVLEHVDKVRNEHIKKALNEGGISMN
jgi:hypothetical protein